MEKFKNIIRNKKVMIVIGGSIGVFICLWIGLGVWETKGNAHLLTEADLKNQTKSEEVVEEPSLILVHIAGAVAKPNVYQLPSNARVIDGIEAAGGMTETADPDSLNLAAYLEDGQKITVVEVGADAELGNPNTGGRININTADKDTLMQLSGIGEVLADNIIQYREKNGGFKTLEELMEVNRIGEKVFENLEDLICI